MCVCVCVCVRMQHYLRLGALLGLSHFGFRALYDFDVRPVQEAAPVTVSTLQHDWPHLLGLLARFESSADIMHSFALWAVNQVHVGGVDRVGECGAEHVGGRALGWGAVHVGWGVRSSAGAR